MAKVERAVDKRGRDAWAAEFEGERDEADVETEADDGQNEQQPANDNPTNERGRIGLSSSPLARPATPLYRLAAQVQDLYYLPEPAPLYVALGTLAANMMAGLPLWMMLTGAPGAWKTTCVRSLGLVPRVLDIGDVSGKGAFLSGVANKDKDKGATGGMLREIGERGMMLMEDFSTSIMSLQRDTRQDIISTLRLVYNGEFSRDVGSGGARRMSWHGKVGLLAAGTNEIDRQASEANALGERWLYYRFHQGVGEDRGAARSAIRDMQPGVSKRLLSELVRAFIEEMELGWPVDSKGHVVEGVEEVGRKLEGKEETRVLAMGELVSKMRSAPPRDSRFPYEITGPPDREFHTRISAQLRQLYLGLERIGLGADERWTIVGKVARDSMPMNKSSVVWGQADGSSRGGAAYGREGVLELRDGQTVKELGKRAMGGVGEGVSMRACEDLEIMGVVEVEGTGKRVRLTEWARDLVRIGWGR